MATRKANARNRGRGGWYENSDKLLLALIFIGLGLGLAVNQPGPGLIIGTGLGVLAMGFARAADSSTIATSFNVAGYIIALIGVYLIAMAVALLNSFEFIYSPYAAGGVLVVLGIVIVAMARRKR
jgi:hypothetical protein